MSTTGADYSGLGGFANLIFLSDSFGCPADFKVTRNNMLTTNNVGAFSMFLLPNVANWLGEVSGQLSGSESWYEGKLSLNISDNNIEMQPGDFTDLFIYGGNDQTGAPLTLCRDGIIAHNRMVGDVAFNVYLAGGVDNVLVKYNKFEGTQPSEADVYADAGSTNIIVSNNKERANLGFHVVIHPNARNCSCVDNDDSPKDSKVLNLSQDSWVSGRAQSRDETRLPRPKDRMSDKAKRLCKFS
jgi:hypothetical protein